jgi:hypothetical protein
LIKLVICVLDIGSLTNFQIIFKSRKPRNIIPLITCWIKFSNHVTHLSSI